MNNLTFIRLLKIIQSKEISNLWALWTRPLSSMPLAAYILEASDITSQSLANQLLFSSSV
jgi:hypothetical protein